MPEYQPSPSLLDKKKKKKEDVNKWELRASQRDDEQKKWHPSESFRLTDDGAKDYTGWGFTLTSSPSGLYI